MPRLLLVPKTICIRLDPLEPTYNLAKEGERDDTDYWTLLVCKADGAGDRRAEVVSTWSGKWRWHSLRMDKAIERQ
jgi:hypothetical protein